jgi:predicted metal-dependent phosphoesterase TrpH
MFETASSDRAVLRADLHVHSWHSGYNHDLPFLRSRDCYSSPEAIYRTAKARGMDLVTITDHDSIDGCVEFLDRHPDAPDFIIGEEISCWFPDTTIEVHFGAWGMTASAHRELQPLRRSAFEVAAFLQETGIPFAFNHPLHFYRGQVPLDRYVTLLGAVSAIETQNGAMLPAHNAIADLLARTGGRHASIGGSDAHTLRRVGRTWTEVPARTREEFLAAITHRACRPGGEHGSTLALAADIYGVIGRYWLSLIGLERHELGLARRGLGLGFSIASAPFEFLPLLIAARQKTTESAWVARCRAGLTFDTATWSIPAPPASSPPICPASPSLE